MKLDLAKRSIAAALAAMMTISFAPVSVFALEQNEEELTEIQTQQVKTEVQEAEEKEVQPEAETIDQENVRGSIEQIEEQNEEVFDAPRASQWSDQADISWYEGNESETEYVLNTAGQLAGLAKIVNGGESFAGKKIILGANIDLNEGFTFNEDGTYEGEGEPNTWAPIGKCIEDDKPFEGVFDGAGYTVSGLYINVNDDEKVTAAGLFGYVKGEDAVIENLYIENSYIKTSGGYNYAVGSLVGINDSAWVLNCGSSAYVVTEISAYTGSRTVGGLIGEGTEFVMATDCFFTGKIKATANVRMLEGIYAGGIIGLMENGYIENCYSAADIAVNKTIQNDVSMVVGGIVGLIDAPRYGTYAVAYCYFMEDGDLAAIGLDTSEAIVCDGIMTGKFADIDGQIQVDKEYKKTLDLQGTLNEVLNLWYAKVMAGTSGEDVEMHGNIMPWEIMSGRNGGYPVFDVLEIKAPTFERMSWNDAQQAQNVEIKNNANYDVMIKVIVPDKFEGNETILVQAGKTENYVISTQRELGKGTYSKTIKFKYNGNVVENVPVSVTVNAVTLTDITNVTATPITYGQKLSNSEISGLVRFNGAVVQGTFAWMDSAVVPAASGDQMAKFTPNELTKYNAVENIAVNVTVNPANITVENVRASGIVTGQNLSNSLIAGEAKFNGNAVLGTFAWMDSAVVPAASGDQMAKFTPNDLAKYNAVENIAVNVTVSQYGMSLANAVDFTNVELGYANAQAVTYTVKNTGNAELTGVDAALLGANAGSFVLDKTGMANTLAVGGETSFTVTFALGAGIGDYAASVKVAANEYANGVEKAIALNVAAPQAPQNNANLSALGVNGSTTSTTSDAQNATIVKTANVANSVANIEIVPTAEDANAIIKVNGTQTTSGVGVNVALAVGLNTITVDVTAPDGLTIQQYTISITRAAAATSGNNGGGGGGGSSSPSYKARTLTDTKSGITITGEQLTTSAKIVISEMKLHEADKCEACKEIAEAVKGEDFIVGYDISLTPSTAMKGTVTVTVPAKGAADGDVMVLHCKDNKLEKIKAVVENEKVSFTVDSFSPFAIVKVDPEADDYKNPFEDVKETDWFNEDVTYAYLFNLMKGTSETKFEPTKATSRAMLVTILWRLEGQPGYTANNSFDDVKAGQWYTDGILWAAGNNIVKGYSEAAFGPNDALTREQLAVILYRYAQFKGYDVTKTEEINTFADNAKVSDWALAAVKWAFAEELITGTTTGLMPAGEAQRAQTAAILHRFIENIAKKI